MKLSRLFGLIIGVVLAVNLIAVGIASAASDPEFSGSVKQPFKVLSGTTTLASALQSVTCSKDEGNGEVEGVSKVGKIVVTFSNCVAKEGTQEACTAKTDGGSTGIITTRTLDGELGLVAKTEAASGVGLLLLPGTGLIFAQISAECLNPTLFDVEGGLAGEATPIGVSSKTGSLVFGGKAGSQSIKTITILGTSKKITQLTAFGAINVAELGTETIDYSGNIEVV